MNRIRRWRQGFKGLALVTLEATPRGLSDRAVSAQVRRLLHPVLGLGVQICIVYECATVKETLAKIADRALNLALRICSVRPAGAGPKAPAPRRPAGAASTACIYFTTIVRA